MALGQHPHIGLQTVSWLLEGEILHRDSLGSEQIIRPGQLNLMTSASGIAHSETSPTSHGPRLHGVQFWVALPEEARHGAAAFEHHAELPERGLGAFRAKVLLGHLGEASSPATIHSPIVGVEVTADKDGREDVPLDPSFEHAVVALVGRSAIGDLPLEIGVLYPVPPGTESLALAMEQGAQIMLVGGAPFPEPILMWWNFVCRRPEEMVAARADWEGGRRFGRVGDLLTRVPAPSLDPGLLRLRR